MQNIFRSTYRNFALTGVLALAISLLTVSWQSWKLPHGIPWES